MNARNLAAAVAVCAPVLSATAAFAGTLTIDTHVHLDACYREPGPGGQWVCDFPAAAATALAAIDATGVHAALLLPPPFSPELFASPRGYDYTDLAPIAASDPARLGFLGGGGLLNSLIHSVHPDSVTSAIREDFEAKAVAIAAAGAAGFGETTALHLSFFPEHPFLETPPDHELFLLLADVAATYGLPIDLHMEAVLEDLELRPEFGPPNPQPPDVVHANIDGLGRLLSHNGEARVVWTHAGVDNTGHMTVGLLDSLLATHPNLYLAVKITAQPGLQFEEHRPVDLNGNIRPEWLQLIADFPDRVMMGSDQFFGIPGVTPPRPPSFESTWNFIGQLPQDLASRVAEDNVRAVYRWSGGTTRAPEPREAVPSLQVGPSVPNPSTGGFELPVRLPRAALVRVDLLDPAGRRLERVHDGLLPAGDHRIVWDGRLRSGRRPAPGVYVVRLTAEGESAATKVVLR